MADREDFATAVGTLVKGIREGVALGSSDLNTVTVPRKYRQTSLSGATLDRNYPVAGMTCMLEVDLWGAPGTSNVIQTLTYARDHGTWVRKRYSAAWSPWLRLVTSDELMSLDARVAALEAAETDPTRAESPGKYAHQVRVNRARQQVGERTSARAQITLICDHGTVKFRDIVYPKLQEHNLPATLALNSAKMPGGHMQDTTNEVDSWDQVKAWASAGIEIANHGRTHQDTDDLATLHDEIVTGHEELEAALGRVVHSWVQPAASGGLGKWFGFDDGLRWDGYMSTDAGRMILDRHAVVTGQIYPKGSYQMTGEPMIGVQGFWLDRDDLIATAQAEVQAATAAKRGVVLRLHPQYIGGQNTAESVGAFLDWLAAERDAGRVDVVTLAQWSFTRIEPTLPGSTEPDTGWRNITSLLGPVVESGRLLLRRKGDETTVIFDDLALAEAHGNLSLPRIGVGFRPRFARARGEWITSTSYTMGGTTAITAPGYFNAYNLPASTPLSMRFKFDATGTFPTALPGDPA